MIAIGQLQTRMARTPISAAPVSPHPPLKSLRRNAAGRTACPLCANATQTVFGEGPEEAALLLVGETPGDREDIAGHPFVGPAGRLLDQCLEVAGIDCKKAYVTNIVKHFKWESRDKRIESDLAPYVIATVHPSSLLRARDEDRGKEIARFTGDLRQVAKALKR